MEVLVQLVLSLPNSCSSTHSIHVHAVVQHDWIRTVRNVTMSILTAGYNCDDVLRSHNSGAATVLDAPGDQ